MTKKRLGITLAALMMLTVALSFGAVACASQKTSETTTTISMENVAAKTTTNLVNINTSFNKETLTKATEAAEAIKAEKEEEKKTEETAKKEEEKIAVTTKAQPQQATQTVTQTTTVKAETTPAPAPAPVQTVDPVAAAQAQADAAAGGVAKVLALTNLERAKAGLGSLALDNTLSAMANIRAQEIVEKWAHERPDGTNVTAIAREYNYSYRVLGENLAKGQTSEAQAVAEWMASPGHRANILGNYNRMGVGIYSAGGRMYWVQIFAI